MIEYRHATGSEFEKDHCNQPEAFWSHNRVKGNRRIVCPRFYGVSAKLYSFSS
jgi:hypothetical protein